MFDGADGLGDHGGILFISRSITVSNQSMYAMYVIGKVESGNSWTAVNYNDPITLGMMQWYGGRAYGLLDKGRDGDPVGWARFKRDAPTLAGQVEANAIAWTGRYLTRAEGNAFITWAARTEFHKVEQDLWESDYASYSATCDNYGFPAGNVRERIFFMSMYHQSPQRALVVLGNVSTTGSLELFHTTALNDSVLGRYPSRYDTVYRLLSSWDGSSAPPDFGQSGSIDVTPGGNNPAIESKPKTTRWIHMQGDDMYLHDGGKVSVFHHATAQNWLESVQKGSEISGGQTEGGSSGGSATSDQRKVYDLYLSWRGRFAYSQAGGRLDPLHTGYGDCSSTIWRAYQDALGIDVGTWTGAMKGKGRRIYASGGTSVDEALKNAQTGDLLLLCWGYDYVNYDHVEMVTGDGTHCLGHGGPGNGPTLKDMKATMQAAATWEIRRYI